MSHYYYTENLEEEGAFDALVEESMEEQKKGAKHFVNYIKNRLALRKEVIDNGYRNNRN